MASAEGLVITVVGATGQQGFSVVRALLEENKTRKLKLTIRCLSRNPASAEKKISMLDTQNTEIEYVKCDVGKEEDLNNAFSGTWGVFFATFASQDADSEEREAADGRRIVDACIKAKVQYVVFSSVGGAHLSTGIPHFESKRRVEEYLIANFKNQLTILRPSFFMDNFLNFMQIKNGSFSFPLPADRKVQMIAVRDIGIFASKAFSDPDSWSGVQLDISGDSCSMSDVATIVSQVSKCEVKFSPVPGIAKFVMGFLMDDMMKMVNWFDSHGYVADIDECRKHHKDLMDFRQFVAANSQAFDKDVIGYKGMSKGQIMVYSALIGVAGYGAYFLYNKYGQKKD